MKKRVALVIAEKNFRDEEYLHPKEILCKAGLEVITVSTTTGPVRGKLGAEARPDLLLSEVKPEEIDALVFVGGGGAEQYFEDQTAHRLARRIVDSGKLLAAICIAPVILAKAGLLKGKKATVWFEGAEDLENGGAIYTGAPVQTDERIITANGPEAAEAFGREILKQLDD